MKKIILLIITIIIQTSFIVGQDCVVCSQNPTAFGASIIGLNSTAEGIGSLALGTNSHTASFAGNSIAIGTQVKTVASLSVVIGSGRDSYNMLENNLQQTLMIGFGSKFPTLFVGRSLSALRTGKIGIGNVTSPEAKLHLRADEDEEAAVFIEPNSWDAKALAHLWLGNQSHGITANYLSGLSFHTQSFYLFNDGNVGIGTTLPQAKLHVAGTIAINSIIEFKTPEAEIIWGRDKMLFKGYKEETDTLHKGDDIPVPVMGGLYTIMELDSRTGYVGVNTTSPRYNLQVTGSLFTNKFTLFDKQSPPEEGYVLQCDELGNAYWSSPAASAGLWKVNPNNNIDLYFTDGNVGIGTIDTYGYRLAVNGKILTDEVMVKHPDNWSDYVFEPDYKLLTLAEVESFVLENKHLPDVPSEKDVTENGYGVSEMNSILLKKIEELTLYLIEQQNVMESQQIEITKMKEFIGIEK